METIFLVEADHSVKSQLFYLLSISYGIAGGFITYCIVKTCKKQAKDVHPVIWVVAVLFILDFIITAVL